MLTGTKNIFSHSFFLLCFLASGFTSLSQNITIHGIVKDHSSSQPIPNVHIVINGSNQGVFTGPDGQFSLPVPNTPVSLTLSCIGYTPLFYPVSKVSAKLYEFTLRQQISSLQEVEITSMSYHYLFRDEDYSVIDYEIMGDNILLLIFRNQLRKNALLLLNSKGDTLCSSPVPEQKPLCLYRDFQENIHYISTRGNTFQCAYDDLLKQLWFPYRTTHDSLIRMMKPFLFNTDERLYFEEFTQDGFGKNIGYFDSDHQKHYIHYISGENTRASFMDDLKFNSRWNSFTEGPSRFTEDNYRANQLWHYQKINAPLVKLDEKKVAIFNYTDGVIEFMDENGRVYNTIPIDFHKESNENLVAGLLGVFIPFSEWEWSTKLFVDQYYRDVYTSFTKNGMVQIRKIDLNTGKLTRKFDVPFPFARKIQIYKGDAYFLSKEVGGSYEKWKLIKLNL